MKHPGLKGIMAPASKSKNVSVSKAARVMEEGDVKLTVELPIDAHRRLKARAAMEGKSMRDFLLQLMRDASVIE